MAHNVVVIFDDYSTEEEKEPTEQRSSVHTSPLAPYVILSSTNSKAQVPNLNTRGRGRRGGDWEGVGKEVVELPPPLASLL